VTHTLLKAWIDEVPPPAALDAETQPAATPAGHAEFPPV
jgi:hypothetical protein